MEVLWRYCGPAEATRGNYGEKKNEARPIQRSATKVWRVLENVATRVATRVS